MGSWKVGKVYVIAKGQTDEADHTLWDPFVSESASFCYYRLNVQNSFFKQRNLSVQSISRVCLFETPWTTVHQACLSITNSWSLIKFMSIESVMPSNHLILCHPLLLLPLVFPSIRVWRRQCQQVPGQDIPSKFSSNKGTQPWASRYNFPSPVNETHSVWGSWCWARIWIALTTGFLINMLCPSSPARHRPDVLGWRLERLGFYPALFLSVILCWEDLSSPFNQTQKKKGASSDYCFEL